MAADLLKVRIVAPADAKREEIMPHVESQVASMATVYGFIRYVGAVDFITAPAEDGTLHKWTAPEGQVFHEFECDAVAKS